MKRRVERIRSNAFGRAALWICLLQLAAGTPMGFAAFKPAPLAFDLEVVEVNLGETDPGHPPEVIAAVTIQNRTTQTIYLKRPQIQAEIIPLEEHPPIELHSCEVVDVSFSGFHTNPVKIPPLAHLAVKNVHCELPMLGSLNIGGGTPRPSVAEEGLYLLVANVRPPGQPHPDANVNEEYIDNGGNFDDVGDLFTVTELGSTQLTKTISVRNPDSQNLLYEIKQLIERNHAYLTGIVESGIGELRQAIDKVSQSVQALPEAVKSILEPFFNRIQAWLKRILLRGGYLQQLNGVKIKRVAS